MPTLTIFDQSFLEGAFPGSTARYDALRALAALQGLANRSRPRLFLTGTRERLTPAAVDVDRFWLARLCASGGPLHGWRVESVEDPWEVFARFARHARGVVLWDDAVPATANVASTVAGAAGLVPVRGATGSGSFWLRFRRRFPRLRVVVDLRGRFPIDAGAGGTGSAKCDAYRWAVESLLRTGRCDPRWAASYPDGMRWAGRPPYDAAGTPDYPDLQNADLVNHDFFVARRAFFFDLSPWGDEAPSDDPDQPLGADLATMKSILAAANDRLDADGDDDLITVGGFVPWWIKYADYEDNGRAAANSRHGAVPGEWEMVAICSAWNAVLDADAHGLDAMANASVYGQMPVDETPFATAASAARLRLGRTGPADVLHACFYVGDFDSAAWMAQTLPRLWEDPGRGRIPLTWAFNPVLALRVPHVFDYVGRTRTALDTFCAGDGAGYVNPVHLEAPRVHSDRPTELDRYRRFAARHHDRFSMGITGFIINGEDRALTPAMRRTLARVSPHGVGVYRQRPRMLLDGRTPFVECDASFGHRASVRELVERIGSDVRRYARRTATRPAPDFRLYRTVLVPPTILAEAADELAARHPDRFRVVGAPEFYASARAALERSGGEIR